MQNPESFFLPVIVLEKALRVFQTTTKFTANVPLKNQTGTRYVRTTTIDTAIFTFRFTVIFLIYR